MQRSVLIVDDETNLLVLLDSVLSKEGFHVSTASNAYEALEIFDHGRFNIAILDIKMFPVGGVVLLAEMPRLETRRRKCVADGAQRRPRTADPLLQRRRHAVRRRIRGLRTQHRAACRGHLPPLAPGSGAPPTHGRAPPPGPLI